MVEKNEKTTPKKTAPKTKTGTVSVRKKKLAPVEVPTEGAEVQKETAAGTPAEGSQETVKKKPVRRAPRKKVPAAPAEVPQGTEAAAAPAAEKHVRKPRAKVKKEQAVEAVPAPTPTPAPAAEEKKPPVQAAVPTKVEQILEKSATKEPTPPLTKPEVKISEQKQVNVAPARVATMPVPAPTPAPAAI
jgi:translation initiation factor IF-2